MPKETPGLRFAHLCEGGQLSVHESQELLLGECAVVPFVPCIPLEDGQQRLDAAFGLRGLQEQEQARLALQGATGSQTSNLAPFLEEGWAKRGLLQLFSARSLLCPTCPAAFFFGISFSAILAQHGGAGLGRGSWKIPWGNISSHQRSVPGGKEFALQPQQRANFFHALQHGWTEAALLER